MSEIRFVGAAKKERIAAIVVTYNRKHLLGECLQILLNQICPIDAVYIIDNDSTDGTAEYLKERDFIDKPLYSDKEPLEAIKILPLPRYPQKTVEIHYVKMHENTGGAGGFYEGIKRGYNAGFDWLWLMDDDIDAGEDCLENLLSTARSDENILVVTPLKLFREGYIGGANMNFSFKNPFCRRLKFFRVYVPEADNGFEKILKNLPDKIEVSDVPFEGCLINKRAVDLAGLPRRELFIFADDFEYCLRIKRFGKIVISGRALVKRKLPLSKNLYYMIRNFIYIERMYGENMLVRNFRPFVYFMKAAIKSLLTLRIIKEMPIIFRAYIDGISGNMGKQ